MWKMGRIRCGEETSKSAVLFCPSICLEDLGKFMEVLSHDTWLLVKGKGKAVPLQSWSGPEGSRKLRFPDFMTTAQDGGEVVSLNAPASLTPRKCS